jgi:DNA repair exonuclease SbcCD ATPase subunit
MRYPIVFVVSAALFVSEFALVSVATPINPPVQNSAQENVATLRAQLNEIETKRSELQTRLQRLEESLKPENIEHGLAGVGSSHPEELREQRRRELEIERNGVKAQLALLETSHARLETAIAQAEAEAYRQSAAPLRGPSIDTSPTAASSTAAAKTRTRPRRVRKHKTRALRRQ